MKIGENGQIEETTSGEKSAFGWSNEEIIFMYLSTRCAFISHKAEIKQRLKSAKMLKTLLETMGEDDDESQGIMIHSKGKSRAEMMEEMKKSLEHVEDENPSFNMTKAIYTKLFPYWIILKESAEDLVKEVVDKYFNAEDKTIQTALNEDKID